MRGASLTALMVSAARGVSKDARGAALDPYASSLLPRGVGLAVRALAAVTSRPTLHHALELVSLGLVSHVALRTLAIDREVAAFTARAPRGQLLILGAGADSRAHRLPGISGIRVFEVDHPDTQREKARRARMLPGSGATTYVAVDFEHDALDTALGHAGLDGNVPTMTIWEGVTPYLTPDAIRGTLAVLRTLLAPESVLAVTYGLPQMTIVPRALLPAVDMSFRVLGEPLLGLVARETFTGWLEAAGYRSVSDTGSDDWARTEGRRAPFAPIYERLAIART